jgi:hypothetical protein
MAEVFAYAPADFELKPSKLFWDSPCWLNADLVLCPTTEATRQKFWLNLSMPHRVDAFARLSWEDQLWKAFSPRIDLVSGPHADAWWPRLMDCYENLKQGLKQTDTIFQEPFHFVRRQGFETVDLPTILKENPENLNVYLAIEKGSYSEYMHLRIHSSPPFIGAKPRCLWFEKRLSDNLHTEDVLPWFIATLHRLPKKHQPADVEPWAKRLLHFEPQLAPPTSGAEKPWPEKPDLILVLGPTAKVGYRSLTHFERRDIGHVIRKGDMVRVVGKERFHWRDNKTMEVERTFHLLAFDEAAAERVEKRILSGERVHFGLDADVLGMICQNSSFIHAINAPEEIIRQLCVEPGLELRLISTPRGKLKTYEACKPGTPHLADFA